MIGTSKSTHKKKRFTQPVNWCQTLAINHSIEHNHARIILVSEHNHKIVSECLFFSSLSSQLPTGIEDDAVDTPLEVKHTPSLCVILSDFHVI